MLMYKDPPNFVLTKLGIATYYGYILKDGVTELLYYTNCNGNYVIREVEVTIMDNIEKAVRHAFNAN